MNNSLSYPHLLKSRLLDDLPDSQKAHFLDQCSVRFHERPTLVLTQGEHPQGLLMVAHGMVEVSFQTEDFHRSFIYHAGPGEVLGDVEAILNKPCAANCMTTPNTVLLFCSTNLLLGQLKSEIFVRNLIAIFYDRMQRDNKIKYIDQFYSVDQKICGYINQLSSDRKPVITRSQAYLANLVGCSRQTMNRTLGTLREDGIIALRKGAIEILDRAALQRRIDMK